MNAVNAILCLVIDWGFEFSVLAKCESAKGNVKIYKEHAGLTCECNNAGILKGKLSRRFEGEAKCGPVLLWSVAFLRDVCGALGRRIDST